MTETEAREWVKSVKVAGESLTIIGARIKSHSVMFVLDPTQEQLAELTIGEPLRMQESDPENQLMKAGEKIAVAISIDDVSTN